MKEYSFYSLIKEKRVIVPEYQREYAQGRKGDSVRLIREGLISAIIDALDGSSKNLNLHYVFGGSENYGSSEFSPVDGQQRLTTLFLVHWYIFTRARDKKNKKLLRKFSYATRSSSNEFCRRLVTEKFVNLENYKSSDIIKYSLSEEIKNQSWFTGSMESDPTVSSMLVVLDLIHEKLGRRDDFEKLVEKLTTEDDCCIRFKYLDTGELLGSEDSIRDLYIKMNARGVKLTDFEIFKSQFETIELEKLNNDYTNLFFKVIDGGIIIDDSVESKGNDTSEVQLYDVAMMNLVNEIIRTEFLLLADKKGVDTKKYRAENDRIKKMSGKEFSDFYNKKGSDFFSEKKENDKISEEEVGKCFEEAENRITTIFDYLVTIKNKKPDNHLLKELINKNRLGVNPHENGKLTANETVYRFAICEYIYAFGSLKSTNHDTLYGTWMSLVWRIIKNSGFRNYDENCKAMRGIRSLREKLESKINTNITTETTEAAGPTVQNIYECISELSEDAFGNTEGVKNQLKEEILKANLMKVKPGNDWEIAIRDIEQYFSKKDNQRKDCDGQIGFALELSKKDDVNSNTGDQYDVETFKKIVSVTKELFNGDKTLKEKYLNEHIFERYLLTVADAEESHFFNMNGISPFSKRFAEGKFENCLSIKGTVKEKLNAEIPRKIVEKAIKKLSEEQLSKKDLAYYEVMKKGIMDFEANDDTPEWKTILIKNDLHGIANELGLTFKGGFEPMESDGRILVYENEQRREKSYELHSIMLASKLSHLLKKDEYEIVCGICKGSGDKEKELNRKRGIKITDKNNQHHSISVYYENHHFVIKERLKCKSLNSAVIQVLLLLQQRRIKRNQPLKKRKTKLFK